MPKTTLDRRRSIVTSAIVAITLGTSIGFSEEPARIEDAIFVAKTVRVDGTPAPGVRVQVIDPSSREVVAQSTTDSRGMTAIELDISEATKFRVDVRGGGMIFVRQYDLPVAAEDMRGNVRSHDGLAITVSPGKTLERSFRVNGAARIRGKITSSGNPVRAQVHFALTSEIDRGGRPVCVPLKPITTASQNVDDEYELLVHPYAPVARTHPAGLVVVAYTDDGLLGWASTAGSEATLRGVSGVDIELRATRTVEVRASLKNGDPVAGVHVRLLLCPDDAASPEGAGRSKACTVICDREKTSAKGTLRITHKPAIGRLRAVLSRTTGAPAARSSADHVILHIEEVTPVRERR